MPDAPEDPIAVAAEQAEDAGLWFVPRTVTEDYLQRALRRLHAAIEREPWSERRVVD